MLIESPIINKNDTRIKCGNCKSEYNARCVAENKGNTTEHTTWDYSCPVCGHGKFQESYVNKGKQILHD